MKQTTGEKLYTLKEACELLSISTATGRNWIKAGRLIPTILPDKKNVFSESALLSLKSSLSSGEFPQLKGRRNKSFVNGTKSYRTYISKSSANHTALTQLLAILDTKELILDETLLLCLLRDCAEQLIISSGMGLTDCFTTLLNDLISAKKFLQFKESCSFLCNITYTYIAEEDTLGFLYLSLYNIKDRKSSGSYYTPARLAKRLVASHLPDFCIEKNILDPSCGTGVFLLQLPQQLPLSHLFGTDLNPVSVALARINLAIKYRITTQKETECLKHNITVSDFLSSTNSSDIQYDIILGNPPWGARLSAKEKENYRKHLSCAAGSSPETFDLFIEQSLNRLSQNGIISFVLPEALLTVKAHTTVRQLLLENTSVLSVEYLGEVFDHVHCPSILLTVKKTTNQPFFKNVTVFTGKHTFLSATERIYSADCFAFSLTDEEYRLLHKISVCPKRTTLVEHSDFALGIVTGNNASLLSEIAAHGLEPVVKGTDISKYHINVPSCYLKYQPEIFQQTAPEHYYRAPEKLFYRFINKQLIFAYDDTGLLSLNSCNILIPRINGLSVKYILAILNSKVAQFFFEKKFRSVKVLRSHLEQIPIPLTDKETQEEIVELVNILIESDSSSDEHVTTYALLDKKVADLFHLTTEEYKLICVS